MKKLLFIVLLGSGIRQASAQLVAGEVLNQTAGRVIRAIDLKVQRMQNQTLWLQNAQKVLENELSKLRLGEIAGYSDRQQTLFSGYYQELWQIKSYIRYYPRIKELLVGQAAMVGAYRQYWQLIRNDPHFSVGELRQMQQVYAGILNASARNLDQLIRAITGNQTQMSDGQRLELINSAGSQLDGNYSDLQQFNTQNEILSLERAQDQNEVMTLKRYYGLH